MQSLRGGPWKIIAKSQGGLLKLCSLDLEFSSHPPCTFWLVPQGGLGIPNLRVEAPKQYAASHLFTKQHVSSIKRQSEALEPREQSIDDLKRIQRAAKTEIPKSRMHAIDATLSPDVLFLVMQSSDRGARSCLNAIPLKDQGSPLN